MTHTLLGFVAPLVAGVLVLVLAGYAIMAFIAGLAFLYGKMVNEEDLL